VIEGLGVLCVGDLMDLIKFKSKDILEKDIIIRKGSKDLNLKAPISELYNTEDEALEVITNGRHYINKI
jgi:hypothetical protein